MANEIFSKMKNQFPVTKTIAMKLVPVGETDKHIRKEGMNLIDDAVQLEEDCERLKIAADRVHRRFIETTLNGVHLKYLSDGAKDSIQEYAAIYNATELTDEEKEDKLEEIAVNLKRQIGEAFRSVGYPENPKVRNYLDALSGQYLVKDILDRETLSEQETKSLARMKLYTSYMRPYCESKSRIYDEEQDGHTIPNRIIDDNLPIHLNNVNRYHLLPEAIRDNENELFKKLSNLFAVENPDEVFSVSYASLLGNQSSIDAYNTLIGGYSTKEGEKVKGLNEFINEYNQKNGTKLSEFKQLMKQILTEKGSLSWIPKTLKDDEEAIRIAEVIAKESDEKLATIPAYGNKAESSDTACIYVKANKLNDYSHALYGIWIAAESALKKKLQGENPRRPREKDKGYTARIEKIFNSHKRFSVKDIEAAMSEYDPENASKCRFSSFVKEMMVGPYVSAQAKYAEFVGSLKNGKPDGPLGQDETTGKQGSGAYLKDYFDEMNKTFKAISFFCTGGPLQENDYEFLNSVLKPVDSIRSAYKDAYESIKGYLTKKPYKTDKTRMYFQIPGLLEGWDKKKEDLRRSVILRKDDELYLAIIPKGIKNIFDNPECREPESRLKKMEVKYLPNPHMSLPHRAFPTKSEPVFPIPAKVKKLVGSKKPVAEYDRKEVEMMVDFYKNVIKANEDWQAFGFKFKASSEYERLNDFYLDVARQNYINWYWGVSEAFVKEAVSKGELYLFRITCQDMGDCHHGKDGNYKTLLYEALSEKGNGLVRLCGGGAVYFRKASLEKKVTHPAGVPMVNKNPNTKEKTRTLCYDLYKDKRYTEDQYMLHIPLKVNPNANEKGAKYVNSLVRDIIRKNPDMYVLGINRGERNLISIAVTAPDGTIVEQKNLNVFDNFDYRRKLEEREKERNDNRRNWNAVKDIKNLKAGYLSRAIGEITNLVNKYGCIIAMENLDLAFKNSRQAFERNVYEQFERDVIGKFGLYMSKDDPDRIKNALQLTNPGTTEFERTKYIQNGIVFFVSPSWITKTDPLTGFVNRLDTRFKSVKEAEDFIGRLDDFRYSPADDRFKIAFHYDKAAPGCEAGDGQRKWVIETFGERIERIQVENAPKGTTIEKTVCLTEEMKKLLDDTGIAYEDGETLLDKLLGKTGEFYKQLYRILSLTLQNTNWNKNDREYRVIGCTANASGKFYDSRTATEKMPKDGDTNAAWNIARKTHMVLRRIREYDPLNPPCNEEGKAIPLHLAVTDAEWFNQIQN